MELVEILKALGEPMRLRIMNLLKVDTLCVCDLETVLDMTQSNASRHLATLRRAGLISGEKKAQWVYYRLDSGIVAEYPFLAELFADGLDKLPQCRKDLLKLKKYRELGGDCSHSISMEGE